MKVKLIFDDWRQKGRASSIYSTGLGVSLSSGDLHSGSTFEAQVSLDDPETEREIVAAWRAHGAYPVFRIMPKE